jgi:hypothetical protein
MNNGVQDIPAYDAEQTFLRYKIACHCDKTAQWIMQRDPVLIAFLYASDLPVRTAAYILLLKNQTRFFDAMQTIPLCTSIIFV